jgi:hypothetical protein
MPIERIDIANTLLRFVHQKFELHSIETVVGLLYWLPNKNVLYDRVHLVSGVVYSASRVAALEALVSTVLPEFIMWIQTILAVPEESTAWNDGWGVRKLRFNGLLLV